MDIRQTVVCLLALGSGIPAAYGGNLITQGMTPTRRKILERFMSNTAFKLDPYRVQAEHLTNFSSAILGFYFLNYDMESMSCSKSVLGIILVSELITILSVVGQQRSHEFAAQIVDSYVKKAMDQRELTDPTKTHLIATALIPPLVGLIGFAATRKLVRTLIQKIRETQDLSCGTRITLTDLISISA